MGRALEGWEEPVFHLGVATGTIRKYSDTLTIFLLKGAKPEKYRENSRVELSGHLALGDMTDDDIKAELAALMGDVGLATPGDGSELI